MMNGMKLGILTVAAVAAGGCSSDWAQRMGYHMLSNAGQMQCQKAMADDCEKRPDYDRYQRERREATDTQSPQ